MKAARKTVTYTVLAMSLALVAPLAAAVDVGVGMNLNRDGGGSGGYGVSMPLRFGNIMVEPELSFYDSSEDTRYPLSPASNRTYESRRYSLETGIYWRQQVIPSVETYMGGRIGYARYDYSYTYASSPSDSYETSGYYLGPTLGAEYFFNKHFSLGLDVSLLFESATRDRIGSGPYTVDRDEINYQSRARLRFYF